MVSTLDRHDRSDSLNGESNRASLAGGFYTSAQKQVKVGPLVEFFAGTEARATITTYIVVLVIGLSLGFGLPPPAISKSSPESGLYENLCSVVERTGQQAHTRTLDNVIPQVGTLQAQSWVGSTSVRGACLFVSFAKRTASSCVHLSTFH